MADKKEGERLFSYCNWGLFTKNFEKWGAESRTQVFPSQSDAPSTMLWIHMFKFNRRRGILSPSAQFPGVQGNLLVNKDLSNFNSKKKKNKGKTCQWNLHLWDKGEDKQENEKGNMHVGLFPFTLNH